MPKANPRPAGYQGGHSLTVRNKPYFVRHLDCGDFVTVLNAKGIKVTGKKATQKLTSATAATGGGR